MPTYYNLQPDYSRNWAKVWDDVLDEDRRPAPTCGKCERPIVPHRPGGGWGSLRYWIPPGKPHGDFYHHAYDIMVDERAKDVLSEHVLSGVSFLEAEVTYPCKTRLWSIEVTNRCAMHPDCNVQLVSVCPECGEHDYSTWDGGIRVADCGHDMFRLVEHPGKIFVSESMKQMLEAAQLKNLAFVDASSIHDEMARYRRARKT